MIQATPVILCGGSGTRLWPLSRTGFPKQSLCLTGKESLFQQAAQRLTNLGNDHIALQTPLIVTVEDHRFLASEQLREVSIPLGAALLEPIGRNTSPALTLDALTAMEGGQDRVLVVSPADQPVANDTAFIKAVQGSAHMGDVLTSNSQNTLVHATSRLVSLVGVSDLIVVETPDAVLVAEKTAAKR